MRISNKIHMMKIKLWPLIILTMTIVLKWLRCGLNCVKSNIPISICISLRESVVTRTFTCLSVSSIVSAVSRFIATAVGKICKPHCTEKLRQLKTPQLKRNNLEMIVNVTLTVYNETMFYKMILFSTHINTGF